MKEENIVIGAGTEYPLDGRLTLPDDGNGSYPAAILVHGSGPSDRDESIGENRPFKDLACGLADKGVAVLRYDKRIFVYGKKMKKDSGLTVKEETIDDAILAANLLRDDERINPEKVFIIGHSLGGMLAPRIDAEGGDFTGIVIMAGSPRRFEEILMDQNKDVLNGLNKLVQWMARKQVASLSRKFDNLYDLSDEEAKSKPILGKYTRAYYFKEMGSHPAADFLKATDKPILIMQGEKDFQVTVEKDFNDYKRLLGDRSNVSFKTYPDLNHMFMPSIYGEILKARKEYKVAQHVDEKVIDDISRWILSIQ